MVTRPPHLAFLCLYCMHCRIVTRYASLATKRSGSCHKLIQTLIGFSQRYHSTRRTGNFRVQKFSRLPAYDVLAILFAVLIFAEAGDHENFKFYLVRTRAMESCETECCVRGYHVYQRIWDATIGEVLDCDREPDNAVDHYAVKLSSCLFNHSYLFVGTTNGGSAQRLRQAPFWVRKLTCSMNLHFRPRVCSWRLKISRILFSRIKVSREYRENFMLAKFSRPTVHKLLFF